MYQSPFIQFSCPTSNTSSRRVRSSPFQDKLTLPGPRISTRQSMVKLKASSQMLQSWERHTLLQQIADSVTLPVKNSRLRPMKSKHSMGALKLDKTCKPDTWTGFSAWCLLWAGPRQRPSSGASAGISCSGPHLESCRQSPRRCGACALSLHSPSRHPSSSRRCPAESYKPLRAAHSH